MKKLLLCFVAMCVCSFAYSQIKIGNSAKPAPAVEPYDSLSNYLGGNIYQYVDQKLYIKPKSEALQKYGYEDFYNSMNKDDIFKPVSKYSSNTDYASLADKTFTVVGIEKRAINSDYEVSLWLDGLENDYIYYLKLTDGCDTVFFKYPSSYVSFPFLVVGYFEKLKQDIGAKYYLKKSADDELTDYVTGQPVSLTPGSLWSVADVVLDGKYLNDILYIFQNTKGEKISCETYRIKFGFIEKTKADRLKAKYGVLFNTVLQGNIKVGMTKELVLAAWGEPNDINKSSQGEQWVYSDQYLYFKNGVLSAFN